MKRYLDRQKYSECQLVAAINAAIHLGEPRIDPDSNEYERLVDMVFARHGSAIGVEKAFPYLRLRAKPLKLSIQRLRWSLAADRPVAITVWHPKIGNHTVLVVDIRGWNSDIKIRVLNFRHGTTKQWMTWQYLKTMLTRSHGEFGAVGGRAKTKWMHEFTIDPLRKRKRNLSANLRPPTIGMTADQG